MMLQTTDYMVDYINKQMDSAKFKREEIKAFETFTDLAMYVYDGQFEAFLNDLEAEQVYDENLPLLENFFYTDIHVFQDESYGYIYYLEV